MSYTSGIARWKNRYDFGHTDPSSGFFYTAVVYILQLSHALADPLNRKASLLLVELLMD